MDKNVIDNLVSNALKALDEYENYDQEEINFIVAKASVEALDKHGYLAKLAIDETKRGIFEDKAIKNMFACEHVVSNMRHLKTVGIVKEDDITGITEIAEPVGVVCGITPVTNPTSTVIFKSLICLKTRNPIIFAFHPSAQESSKAAAKIVYEAALKANAPKNCIQWIEEPSLEATTYLMNHEGVSVILATGGNQMVKAAYSCGKPALGVGAGNVPTYMEKSCDIKQAVNDICLSKAFDNGMVCASEQAVIIDEEIYDEAIKEFERQGVYFTNDKEKELLEKYMFQIKDRNDYENAKLNPFIVGKNASFIAKEAGFEISNNKNLLGAFCKEVGPKEVLTKEKLSPVLAFLKVKDYHEGFNKAKQFVEFNGLGHSASIHTRDYNLVKEYGKLVKAIRIIWNQPSTFGGIGNVYNSFLPSLTLGCGSYGGNSTDNNVSALNLLNIKKIGRRNNNMQWFKVPPKIYFEKNSLMYLKDMREMQRAIIVTDRTMVDLGFVNRITEILNKRKNQVQVQLFCDVEPDPSLDTCLKGVALMRSFSPDTIIALGGGSAMDVAKCMWLFYEHPDVNFNDLKQKFMDIRKRAFRYPELGKKSHLVCIPTTSGTGSEVTPFAVITDTKNNKKYPLTDYSLTPTVAIIDPTLTYSLPKSVIADTGLDVLTHAIEAYTSTLANDYTDALAIASIKMVFKYLLRSYNSNEDYEAKEKMHNASTMAGMAFGNAFLGISHSMAHKLGGVFHVPHGRLNAILLPLVILYNGKRPLKRAVWPKYNKYVCDEKYNEICIAIDLKVDNIEDGVKKLAKACYELAVQTGIKMSLKEQGVDEKEFLDQVENLGYLAYEDQCSPSNPKLPVVEDMIEIMKKAYYGYEIE